MPLILCPATRLPSTHGSTPSSDHRRHPNEQAAYRADSASFCGNSAISLRAGTAKRQNRKWNYESGVRYTAVPSGYCSANRSSLASESTVVPARFQAPSVSNRRSPMRRPHGAMTRPMALKSVRSACSSSRRRTTSGATRMNARSAVADLMLYLRPPQAAPNTWATCLK